MTNLNLNNCMRALCLLITAAWLALPAAAQEPPNNSGFGTLKAAKSDKKRPKIAIVAPANHATVSGNVMITATAMDNFGVAGVQFYVDAVPLGAEVTAAPYSASWNTPAAAEGAHMLTATARDAAGNRTTSVPVTARVLNAGSPASARVEETNPAVTYSAGWAQDTSRSWSGSTAMSTRVAGAQSTLAFSGTSANWIGARGPQYGIARVYIDGALRATVDGYSPSEEIRVSMFTANDLANGPHTLTIEPAGTRNADATDVLVSVDAFDVPAVSVSRLQEVDSAVAYAGNWTRGDTTRAWSEGTAALTATPGDTATFTFTGTAISWLGARSPQTGIAAVYIDGAFVRNVDTYAATEQIQAELFNARVANGTHTIAIQATGGKSAQSTAATIVVDAFEVTVPGRRYQDNDPAITYAPLENWYLNTRDHAYSEGTQAEAVFGGSTATFRFNGTGVSLVSATCIRCGIIRVSIDGGPASEIDLYAATDSPQKTVYSIAGLPPGPHVIVVDVTGLKNPLSTYYWVVVDAFDVIP